MVRFELPKPRVLSRLPSFAGEGLPERMRSTVFLFLGLIAATGLALVAVFAQLGPLPAPAPEPMPIAAPQRSAVAEAVALESGVKPPAIDQATTVLDSAPWPRRCSRCT